DLDDVRNRLGLLAEVDVASEGREQQTRDRERVETPISGLNDGAPHARVPLALPPCVGTLGELRPSGTGRGVVAVSSGSCRHDHSSKTARGTRLCRAGPTDSAMALPADNCGDGLPGSAPMLSSGGEFEPAERAGV